MKISEAISSFQVAMGRFGDVDLHFVEFFYCDSEQELPLENIKFIPKSSLSETDSRSPDVVKTLWVFLVGED